MKSKQTCEKCNHLAEALRGARLYIKGEALPTREQALKVIDIALADTSEPDSTDVARNWRPIRRRIIR